MKDFKSVSISLSSFTSDIVGRKLRRFKASEENKNFFLFFPDNRVLKYYLGEKKCKSSYFLCNCCYALQEFIGEIAENILKIER